MVTIQDQTRFRIRVIELRQRIFENPTVLYDPQNSMYNILYPPSSVEVQ
jgi:hypothetical protein